MTRPWRVLETIATDEGPLELRQRGDDEFLIVIAGRVLMTSAARRSEEALATLALAELASGAAPRVLIGGLGMAYTLRAALDALPATAKVTVAELNPVVATWCRGPMAALTASAASDPRVTITIVDVARAIATAKASYDAILLDLYEGPNAATQRQDDPFYGATALARSKAALRPGGVLAVWSEDPDAGFARRFEKAGFAVTTHRSGKGGRSHVVYLGRVEAGPSAARPGVRRSKR
ncbi:MAG: spermidine synthase [Deltaproteobacteria bacterium]|nr:spermidine synthase [Deltaproteobacteria bacterium]